MLVDHAIITVRSGRGGNGSASFRREKGIPKGGPDGGDGGKGGDVVLVGDAHLDTLAEFAFKVHFFAKPGERGARKKQHGHAGDDLRVRLPLGCLVYDAETDELLVDMVEPGQEFIVAKGGTGGRGNDRFKTPTNQAPTEHEPGGEPVERKIRLELKLIADVGLIGLPNAGKSTLLGAISRATPKIADYPFTTLSPQVGIARLSDIDTLVLADLPGLIEGASEGVGLGHRFLKHVERCGVVLHLVDCSEDALVEPDEARRVIDRELENFDAELARKPRLLVATKVEGEAARERALELGRRAGREVLCISSHTREGLKELLVAAHRMVRQADLKGLPG